MRTLKEIIMKQPVFIARKGSVVLWSWGNYHYSIDINNQEIMTMEDMELDDALKILEVVSNKTQ
jgi:hypothetical protein